MKIQNKLTLMASLAIAAAISISAVAYVTTFLVNSRIDRNRALEGVVEGVAELVILTYEYVEHGQEPALERWRHHFRSLNQRLRTNKSELAAEQEVIDRLQRHLEDLSERIERLVNKRRSVSLHGRGGFLEESFRLEEELFVTQLRSASRLLFNDTFRLTEIERSAVTVIQDRAGWLIMLLVFLLALIVGATSWVVGRSVTQPVAHLNESMQIIGAGDLTHRVGTKTRDEFGDLSRSIDQMTASLHATVNDLNTEVYERKRAEESLWETQRTLRTLLGNLPGMAYRCRNDKNWTMEFISDGCLNLTEYQPAELILNAKVAYAQLIHHEDRRPVWDQVQAALREREAFQLVYRIYTASAKQKWVWEQGIGIFSSEGEVEAIEGFITDISEPKRAEVELVEAKAIAEQANEAKSRFLAAASHDLRQPLQTVSLLNAILSTKLSDREALKLVQKQGEALNAMGGLLNTLLNINKLESGAITPEIRDFSVNQMLERMRYAFERNAQKKGVALRVVNSTAIVNSDPELLERIVENLLSNAIRYTYTGKVLLGCRRRGSHLRIEVWDTGIGIPEDQLETIFEEYYQLDNPARDRSKGLGLGLAIVSSIAHLLEHEIDVRSTPGKGSMFALEVPLGHLKPGQKVLEQVRGTRKEDRTQATILLVEDDKEVLEAMCLFLELHGYAVITAMDARAALDRFADSRPDLVVSDYRLPNGESGMQLIRQLRKASSQNLPGIIITGDTTLESLNQGVGRECQVFHKPVDVDELIMLIHKELTQFESNKRRLVTT